MQPVALENTNAPVQSASGARGKRSVKVPHHRFPPLKKVWMEVYRPVVEQCKLEIRMNLKARCVELRAGPETTDSTVLQKAEDFVKAVVVGFDVADALALLRLDDIYLETFDVKDVRAGLHGDNLSRCIGRMSGSHGKTKHTLENVARVRLVIADTHISMMGATQNLRVARDAICDLIRGSPAAKVYNRVRTVMNRVNDSF
jgi:RNA-binding protein PNO1